MSRWLVNVRGQQFSAANMDELKKLAKAGNLSPGDIVQPPGAAEWMYALEVPELKTSLRNDQLDLDGSGQPVREMNPVLRWGLAAVLALVAAGAWAYALNVANNVPEPDDLELIGEKGLAFTEVLVTADPAQVYASDSTSAQAIGQLPKNSKADLLGKRGDWYRLRSNGQEGFVKITDVIPAFFFADERTQQKYKPLYYPDQYTKVINSSWTMTTGTHNKENLTIFNFMVGNDSQFPMTDLKLLVVVKDQAGNPLERMEIPVEGAIKAGETVFVGTLKADPKDKTATDRIMLSSDYEPLVAADPKVAERWVDGVERKLGSDAFTGAEITVAEVRAVPPDTMEGGK